MRLQTRGKLTRRPSLHPSTPLIKAAAFCAAVLLLCALGTALQSSGILDIDAVVQALRSLTDDNLALAVALYFAFVAVGGSFLALPGVLFAIVAGACFGPVVGTIACVVSSTAGAVLAFLVGRHFLQDVVRPRAMRNELLAKWLFGSQENIVVTLAVTRLVPLFPFNLQNFAYGTTDASLAVYTLCTALFIVPGSALYVTATAGIVDTAHRAICLAVAACLLAATFALTALLKRRYLRKEGA